MEEVLIAALRNAEVESDGFYSALQTFLVVDRSPATGDERDLALADEDFWHDAYGVLTTRFGSDAAALRRLAKRITPCAVVELFTPNLEAVLDGEPIIYPALWDFFEAHRAACTRCRSGIMSSSRFMAEKIIPRLTRHFIR